MDKQTQDLILKWILENHNHHSFVMEEGKDDDDTVCEDGEYPYVNSLELEKFILSLGVKP